MYSVSVATDATAVNTNGIDALSANSLISFFINGIPVLNDGPRSLKFSWLYHLRWLSFG